MKLLKNQPTHFPPQSVRKPPKLGPLEQIVSWHIPNWQYYQHTKRIKSIGKIPHIIWTRNLLSKPCMYYKAKINFYNYINFFQDLVTNKNACIKDNYTILFYVLNHLNKKLVIKLSISSEWFDVTSVYIYIFIIISITGIPCTSLTTFSFNERTKI